jgi:Raf kinase inhibitor-like YbhB/YbcL family protein
MNKPPRGRESGLERELGDYLEPIPTKARGDARPPAVTIFSRALSWQAGMALSFLVGSIVLSSCGAESPRKDKMQLTSTAFAEGAAIPAKYTCDARNVSPPLKWSGAPEGTKSLALIADDPDAPVGTWVHWVIYDLPAPTTELAEDLPKGQFMASGAKQGLNDFKHLGYGGPCPPHGKTHRYFFRIYALDAVLDLKPGLTKKELEHAMEKHILAQGQLMGTYQRK